MKNTAIKVGDKVKCFTDLSIFYGTIIDFKLKKRLAQVKYYKRCAKYSGFESVVDITEWEDIDGLTLITPLEELL